MSQVLTVPTHFNDIGELSEGFLDRVEQDTLILYGPVAYEEGSEIEFAVLLADGTPTLEGVGRVRAAVDGGEDRVPETRYDVVVEALEFDARSEVVFERLVISRQAVSDRPPSEDDAPITDDMRAPSEDDAPEARRSYFFPFFFFLASPSSSVSRSGRSTNSQIARGALSPSWFLASRTIRV